MTRPRCIIARAAAVSSCRAWDGSRGGYCIVLESRFGAGYDSGISVASVKRRQELANGLVEASRRIVVVVDSDGNPGCICAATMGPARAGLWKRRLCF